MPRGGRRPGAGAKPGVSHGPYVPKVIRELARKAFEERFMGKIEPLLEATEKLVDEKNPRTIEFIWERLMGKLEQPLAVPTGDGICNVEVTYKIVSKPDA